MLVIFMIFFLGAFTQSLTGFGSALVAMALLPPLLGLTVAAPLVAGTTLLLESLMLIRYRESLRFDAIWRMLVASLIGAPFGVYFLTRVDEYWALVILGIVIAGYALYALIGFRLPELTHPLWAWGAGLVSGILGGAYNTSGPPVVIYGNCRRWSADEFKSNLSGFFIVNSILITTTHILGGNFSAEVRANLPIAIPALLMGFLVGQLVGKRISPELFRRLVLILLIVLGIRLVT